VAFIVLSKVLGGSISSEVLRIDDFVATTYHNGHQIHPQVPIRVELVPFKGQDSTTKMAKYIRPNLRQAKQSDEDDLKTTRSQGPYQAAALSSAISTTSSTPVWRRGATIRSVIATSAVASSPLPARCTPGPSLSYTNSATNLDTEISPSISSPLSTRTQTTDEAYRYNTYTRTNFLLQPKPIKADQCDENKEYAQWAGGFVEINDKLLSTICPCNLVGKPCAFDESKQLPAGLAKKKHSG
jgi:hypothetical protein